MVLGISRSTSFQDFVTASQKVKPFDALVLKNGLLEKKTPYEVNEETLNERTWIAFKQAVKREFTSKKIETISKSYGFDFYKRARSKVPFERRYVEYFGVAASCPEKCDLEAQQSIFDKPLEDLSPEEIDTLFKKATLNGYLGTVEDPMDISGGVRYFHEQVTRDNYRTDQRLANLFRGIPELVSKDLRIPHMHPYYSRLEMAIISLIDTDPNNANRKWVIPAPRDRDGELDYYEVIKIISKDGLNAIALRPISKDSKLEPLLCFRCTKQTLGHHGFFDSNIENLNEHIGKSGYEACRKELEELINDPKFTGGEKPTVLAYSQGGAYATRFMGDHWPKVGQAIFFNCVGTDDQVVDKIASEINALGEHDVPPAIYHHRNVSNPEGTKGDLVNRVGRKHLGHGIHHQNAIVCLYEWLIKGFPAPTNNIWDPVQLSNWLNLHAVRPMDTDREDQPKSKWDKKWKYSYKLHMGPTQVDPILDTYKRDSSLEDLRHNIGYKIIYQIASEIFSWMNFMVRLFDFDFFKR